MEMVTKDDAVGDAALTDVFALNGACHPQKLGRV